LQNSPHRKLKLLRPEQREDLLPELTTAEEERFAFSARIRSITSTTRIQFVSRSTFLSAARSFPAVSAVHALSIRDSSQQLSSVLV
jgi:hypothetical protein